MSCKIIYEVGLNHLGSIEYGLDYIHNLPYQVNSAITFQVREQDFYKSSEAQKKLELSLEQYRTLREKVKNRGFEFGIAISDIQKIKFFESINTDFYKVLSKDFSNNALIEKLISCNKPLYASTGLSGEEQIKLFVDQYGQKKINLIHTQLTYEDSDANLSAINSMRVKYGLETSFGLHSTDCSAIYAALSFRPNAIFIYIKGNKKKSHPDEGHAIELCNIEAVTRTIRRIEVMVGDGKKQNMINTIPDQKRAL